MSPDLVERVDRDPKLSGEEKETTISMYGGDKRFAIYSAKPTIVKSLLEHDHFEVTWLRVLGDGVTEVETRAAARGLDGDVVAVRGTLPVGTLTVKSKPRANDHQSSVVNTETVDPSVFEA